MDVLISREVKFEKESKLETIGDGAFWWCAIRSIRIPAGVTSIGEKALAVFKPC